MEFFKKQTKIDFMGMRRYTGAFSLILCCACIALLCIRGLNFGLDFTGGVLLELHYPSVMHPDEVRQTALKMQKYKITVRCKIF